MDVRKLRYLAEYLIFCVIIFVIRSLPSRSVSRFADGLAWFLHRVIPRRLTRYKVSANNIRIAFGEDLPDSKVDEIIFGMWQHLTHMVCEIIQMERRIRLNNLSSVIQFYQASDCVKALLSDRPVLFLGGHFGNWEISVNTFGLFGFPMGVVARDLDNPWLHQWFLNFRTSSGNWLISKQGASTELIKAMESGGKASLLCDQDAGRRGVFVDFFGKPASTFKSIAILALQYDALIVVGGAWRLNAEEQQGSRWKQFELSTMDVIDSRDYDDAGGVPRLTQQFTHSLENLVRCAPEQYFWVHRRWKSEPRQKKIRSQKKSEPPNQAA